MNAYNFLCPPLQKWINSRGWKDLRPIQEKAFTPVGNGKNVLLIASTAGGKTEAAMLPLLNRFYLSPNRGVKILYLAPLRALLNNLENRFLETRLCDAVYLETAKWHGDVSRSKRLAVSRKMPDVLLTTPESLDVILYSPYVDKTTFFAPLEAVIIDEAHYFAGNIRGGQIVSVIARLERILNRDLQRIGLSATIGNSYEVLNWISFPSQREKEVIAADGRHPIRDLALYYFDAENEEAVQSMSDRILANSLRTRKVKKSIIFEISRKAAEERSKDFAGQYCIWHVHHGSVDKYWREKAEFDLAKAKSAAIIIATCTLELGIDVGDLDMIQQEGDFPSVSSFVQRIGRTGRNIPPQRCRAYARDEYAFLKNLGIMLLANEGYVENNSLPTNIYSLLLQQMLMLALSKHGISANYAKSILRRCAALKGISDAEWDELINYWIDEKILRVCDSLILVGEAVERRYAEMNYRDLFVLFDSPNVFEVRNGRDAIGTLDSLFVRSRNEEFVFILAGKWWRVKEVDYRENVVYVNAITEIPPPAQWISPRGREIGYQVAQKIKDILLSNDMYPDILGNDEAKNLLIVLRRKAKSMGIDEGPFQIFKTKKFKIEFVTYAGDRVNLLLAGVFRFHKKWIISDVNYSSMVVELDGNSLGNPEMAIKSELMNITKSRLLEDNSFLEQIIAVYDDPESSKWSRWLPKKYRIKMLVPEMTDIESTKAWLESASTHIKK